MTVQAERALQQEIMLRLKRWPVLPLAIPNSIYFPARTDAERSIIARVINQMKDRGQITPGAPDLVLCLRGGGVALVELKRPATRTLLGKTPEGRLSDPQKEMMSRAEELGIAFACVTSWDELEAKLREWGMSPIASGKAA